MTMFSSRTPRDLNHDHMPWADAGGWRSSSGHLGVKTYDPRPEFDHVQHNKPNPILAGILREAVELDAQENPPIHDLASTALYILTAGLEAGEYDEAHTPEQIEHARKVLTRLANLTKEEA